MRRTPPVLSVLVLSAALVLSGCSDSSSDSSPDAPATVMPQSGVEVDCAALTIDADSESLPTVTGDAGALPTVEWSGKDTPANLTVKTLEEGEGAAVGQGDVVVAHYAGWEWGSSQPFDSSYSRGESIPFGLGSVIAGWTCGLVGHKVGERVLMSIPPELGYGQNTGSPGPQGTLVFVVEIIDDVSSQDLDSVIKGASWSGAEQTLTDRGVVLTGELGQEPTITVTSGAPEPTQVEIIEVARGTGEPIAADSQVVANLAVTTWDNSATHSTWQSNFLEVIPMASSPALSDLVGVPVGSRVVILLPGNPTAGTKSEAYVLDVGASL